VPISRPDRRRHASERCIAALPITDADAHPGPSTVTTAGLGYLRSRHDLAAGVFEAYPRPFLAGLVDQSGPADQPIAAWPPAPIFDYAVWLNRYSKTVRSFNLLAVA